MIDNKKNLKLLYAMRVAKNFSSKFAFFFLPIFLYQIGSDLNFRLFSFDAIQRGMLFIACFYLLSRLTSLITVMPIGDFIRKIQPKNGLMVAHFLRLITLILLIFGENQKLLIFLAAIYEGLYVNFFWLSSNYLLGENMKNRHLGKKLGILNSLLQVVSITSPLISGLMAFYFGFQSLFWLGIFFVFLCFVFTYFIKDSKVDDEISWQEFFDWFSEKRYKRLTISFFGGYVYSESLYLWTLYIFLFLGNIKKVGYLYTVSVVLVFFILFLTAKYLDSGKKSKRPFYISGGLISFLWLIRTQFIGLFFLTMIDVCEKLAFNVYGLFYDNLLMKRSVGSQSYSYFVYRNVIISVSGLIFWIFFSLIFSIGSNGWNSVFILTSVGMILSLLMKEKEIIK